MIRWTVSRPAVVWAAVVALVLSGGVAFTRLSLATRTTVELPKLLITAGWTGASAELTEMYLTSPVEAAVQGVRGVRRTSSESREGASRITVDLDPTTDVQLTRLSILERLELLRKDFPAGSTAPFVSNYVPEELSEKPLLRVLLTGPYTKGALQKVANDVITPQVSALPGVSGVTVFGGTEFGVAITYDASLLRQLNIAPSALSQALNEARQVVAIGEERLGTTNRAVVMRDQPAAIEELQALPVRGPGGRIFQLGALATIRPEEDARNAFFRINGFPAIAFSVARGAGADAIKTAKSVRASLQALAPRLPPGVRYEVNADQSEELAAELRDLLIRGAIAFGAVMLVLIIMLRNWRAVALVMGSAAISLAGTSLGLFILDIPSNSLTLAGLGMGIGVLVQNALVVVERLRAAPDTSESRAQVGMRMFPAVLGSTLTTCVVLFPFLYLQGNARAAFVPFAAAFVLGLGWSVVAAILMIPSLSAGHGMRARTWPKLHRLYGHLLVRLLRWRLAVLVLVAAGLGVLAWGFVKKVPRFAYGTYGSGARTTVSAYLSFPRGSDPATLDAAMQEMERVVVGQPGVEDVTARGAGGGSADMTVTITRDAEFTAIPAQIEEAWIQRAVFIGGAQASVRGQGPGFSTGGGGGGMSTYRIKVLGYSYSGVEQVALDLKARLERIARVRDVNVNAAAFWGDARAWSVSLEPDRQALARYGLTARDFASAVSREVRGAVEQQRLEINGDELPVSVKSAGTRERSLDELRAAIVPSPSHAPVKVGDLADVAEREGLGTISRENQQYVRIVSYEFRGPTKLADRTHKAFMASITVPPGYAVGDQGWDFGYTDNSEKGLWLVFGIGITLVVLAVAMVFDSTWAAAMVFLSVPVALGGVIAAFWVTHAAFTREAAVGVILVVGLAVHQAILLIDGVMRRRRGGTPDDRRMLPLTATAICRAAMERSAMIILVTFSTLASLVPLAVGTDMTSLFGAIALATAGGTVFGTFGAMVVLPAMVLPLRWRRGRRKARA